MAILHTKETTGKGILDNITYLIQARDSGKKELSDEELQKIADEQNRQFKLLGVNTQAKVWPTNKKLEPQYLDATDNISVIGDRKAQEEFVGQYFPEDAMSGWSKLSDIGVAPTLRTDLNSNNINTVTPGKYALVDINAAKEFAGMSPQNSLNSILAFLLNHEGYHNFYPSSKSGSGIISGDDGHVGWGVLAEGDLAKYRLSGLKSKVDDLIIDNNNVNIPTKGRVSNASDLVRESIINFRQGGDKNRLASDNYDENKRRATSAFTTSFTTQPIPQVLNHPKMKYPFYSLLPTHKFNK